MSRAATTKPTPAGAPVYINYYRDRKREWRWRIRSKSNVKKLANSGEGYKNRGDMLKTLRTIAAWLPAAIEAAERGVPEQS